MLDNFFTESIMLGNISSFSSISSLSFFHLSHQFLVSSDKFWLKDFSGSLLNFFGRRSSLFLDSFSGFSFLFSSRFLWAITSSFGFSSLLGSITLDLDKIVVMMVVS